MTGPGLPGAVDYSTYDQTDLVEATTFKDSGGTAIATATRTFESNRNLVTSVENKWGTTTVSKYAYVNDTLGRRTSVVNSGTAFVNGGIPGRFSLFGYDDRSQLTGSQRYEGTDLNDQDTPVDLQQYEFEYDTIGNRKSYTADGVLEGVKAYYSNNVNQYTETATPEESFTHDADGNLTEDGEYTYVWDAENRLIEVKPKDPETTSRATWIKMQYDYLGRRIRKLGYRWQTAGIGTPGSWPTNPTSDTRYVYDGWNLLMELDGMDSNAVLRQYTWGLDLSGQNGGAVTSPDRQGVGGLHGAGGIGGLLAMRSGSGTSSTTDDGSYLYFYNANGDIGQLMKTSNEGGGYGTTAARYEYYPFGGDLVSVFNPSSGSNPARNNPFRFSTKYRDSESKCYYYGYRYLRPKHGRWISRDPIEEQDTALLMGFASNQPTNRIDSTGLATISPWGLAKILLDNRVCCQYRDFRPLSFAGFAKSARQVTVVCVPSYDPAQCCKCLLGIKSDDPFRLFDSATRGPCCTCVVQRRVAPGGWPWHAIVYVKCANGVAWYADHTGAGGNASIDLNPVVQAWLIGAYPVIDEQYTISCADADELRKESNTYLRRSHNVWQDCWWFTRKVWHPDDWHQGQ